MYIYYRVLICHRIPGDKKDNRPGCNVVVPKKNKNQMNVNSFAITFP